MWELGLLLGASCMVTGARALCMSPAFAQGTIWLTTCAQQQRQLGRCMGVFKGVKGVGSVGIPSSMMTSARASAFTQGTIWLTTCAQEQGSCRQHRKTYGPFKYFEVLGSGPAAACQLDDRWGQGARRSID